MKIITWNCNMAFRRKTEIVLNLKPDVLIVPECEHSNKLVFGKDVSRPSDTLWFGQNQNKGLGIFSFGKYRIKFLDFHNDAFKLIIPIAVKSPNLNFTLFAIWANNPADPDGQYITQVWKAIHYYDAAITGKSTVLVGDFNSNTIWDRPRRVGNHSTLVQHLEGKGIYSVYHKHFNQEQGKEQHPTLYMYRRKENPYHIDYCFASRELVEHLKSVEIGDYESWIKHSDHVPVIVTFDETLLKKDRKAKKRS